jgi:predicted kinase
MFLNSDRQLLSPTQLIEMLGIPRVIMLMGIPASGKSTLAKQIAEVAGYDYLRLNADSIRQEIYGSETVYGQDEIDILHARFEAALTAGQRVVVDNMHLDDTARLPIIERAKLYGCKLEIVFLDVSFADCLERNNKRSRQIPDWWMCGLADALFSAGFPQPEEGRLTIIRQSESESQSESNQSGRYCIVSEGEPLLLQETVRQWKSDKTPAGVLG